MKPHSLPSPASPSRYPSLSIALHWLMLVLLVAVYACMELRGVFPRGSTARADLKTWHYMLGLTVMVLAWLRLMVVLTGTAPPISPAPPVWQRQAARGVQIALYALMLGMPLLGWLLLSAEGSSIPFYGVQLPPLAGTSKILAEGVKEVHEAGATLGYVLVGLHAVAALYHHYVLRDNTLRRMMPGGR